VAYLIDDPSQEDVLTRAGIERARALVCAVDSDATNVYIALIARSLRSDLFIVARASEPGSDERLRRAGADRVVSPYVSSGRHMARIALRPSVSDVLEIDPDSARSLELDEIRVDAGSAFVGRTLAEVARGAIPLALQRSGGEVTPHPDEQTRLAEGDLVVLLPQRGR
jgi:voltage-gated potassium channel